MSLFAAIPRPLSRFILSQLRRSPPPAVMDTPEELEVRELVAQAAIARLAPVNTAEALLAVRRHEAAMEAPAIDAEAARSAAFGPEMDDAASGESRITRQNPMIRCFETKSGRPGVPRSPWTGVHPGLGPLAAFILAATRDEGALPAKSTIHDAAWPDRPRRSGRWVRAGCQESIAVGLIALAWSASNSK